jgi:hypothetical protein
MTSAKTSATTAGRAQFALAFVGLALAAISLASDLLDLCRSCGTGDALRLGIGGAGVAGYAALGIAPVMGADALFQSGVLAAAAVHVALATWMVTAGSLCPFCLLAAIAAFANVGIGLAAGRAPLSLLERAFLPVLLVASGVVFALALHDGKEAAARHAAVRAESTAPPRSVSPDAVRLVVYENDHCGYCREFRDAYAPRLARDFGSRLSVEYRDAGSAPWLRRTPTLAIEGGDVFEGLPARYEDLHAAVAAAIREEAR